MSRRLSLPSEDSRDPGDAADAHPCRCGTSRLSLRDRWARQGLPRAVAVRSVRGRGLRLPQSPIDVGEVARVRRPGLLVGAKAVVVGEVTLLAIVVERSEE